MLEDLSLLRFTLLSILIGFGTFCVSYAAVVWNRRNAGIDKKYGAWYTWLGHVRRLSVLVLILGVVGMSIGWAVRETLLAEGKLNGDELFTVRARQDAQLDWINENEFVTEGDVVAKFTSATTEAEIHELECTVEKLLAEKRALALEPLELDPELVRRHDSLIADRRALGDSLRHLIPAYEEVIREGLQSRLEREEEVAELQVNVDWYKGEIEQSIARRDFNQKQLEREQDLVEQDAAIERDVDGWVRETKVYDVEVGKMKDRVKDISAHQDALRKSLSESKTLLEQQTDTLKRTIDETQQQLADVNMQEKELRDRLAVDAERAEGNRTEALKQIDFEVREAEAKLEGLRGSLIATAPYYGRVIYRSRSPRAVYQEGPIVVIGPREGYRMRMRLPVSQLASLKESEDLFIQLDYTHQVRRVAAHYRGDEPMEWEPGFTLVELDCLLPHETAWMLAEGEEVRASLDWRPPLITLWPFQAGLGLLLLGGLGIVLSTVSRGMLLAIQPANGAEASEQEDADGMEESKELRLQPASSGIPQAPAKSMLGKAAPAMKEDVDRTDGRHSIEVAAAESMQLGATATTLNMLANRFRTSLEQREVEADLLGAVEWALDRHQQRAVRILSQRLEGNEEVSRILDEDDQSEDGDRLRRILRVLRPELTAN